MPTTTTKKNEETNVFSTTGLNYWIFIYIKINLGLYLARCKTMNSQKYKTIHNELKM